MNDFDAGQGDLVLDMATCLGAFTMLAAHDMKMLWAFPDATKLGWEWVEAHDDLVRKITESLFDRSARTGEAPPGTHQNNLEIAAYSLVYLGKTERLICLQMASFGVLIRALTRDPHFQAIVSFDFADTVFRQLYDMEEMEEAWEGEPFEWAANLNSYSDEERRRWLAMAGLSPLEHAWCPPQNVWRAHTCVTHGSEQEYREQMRKAAEECDLL